MSQTVNDRVSDVVKSALETTHYSVTTLAREIGVSRNTIYRWSDKESKNIEPEHLLSISEVLGVSIDWLRMGTGDKYKSERKNSESRSDAGTNKQTVIYQLSDVVDDTNREPTLDELPQLVRLRDMIDAKIQKLVNRRTPPSED